MIWLLIVASTSGFASSVYLGGHGYRSLGQCAHALARIEHDYGYGGMCRTGPPQPLSAEQFNRMTPVEKDVREQRDRDSVLLTNIHS